MADGVRGRPDLRPSSAQPTPLRGNPLLQIRHAVVATVVALTTVLLPAASGTAATPGSRIRSIQGAATGITSPQSLARDSKGNVYVANLRSNAVLVFAPGARGNADPIGRIKGSATRINGPAGLAFDPKGNLYVTSYYTGKVLRFAAGARGNVKPTRVIGGYNTGLEYPTDIARDAKGRLYVTDNGQNSVSVFSPTARGNVPPVRKIRGSNTRLALPKSVALDSAGRIFVSNEDSGFITVFSPSANGNVGPVRILGNGLTDGGIALDPADRVYAGSWSADGSPVVNVYRAGANGSVSPMRTIAGPATGADGSGVMLDPQNDVWVSLWSSSASTDTGLVNEYAAVLSVVPGPVRHLAVAGTAGAATRAVSWQAPGDPGAAQVQKYRVVVKKGTRKLFATTTTQRSISIARSRLAAGTDTVVVRAVNKYGAGAAASRSFTVRK